MSGRSGMVEELLARLGEGFEAARDPDRAIDAAAYMRRQFAFYGIRAPEQARIAHEATLDLPPPTEAQLKRLALACWSKDEREWQYFACGYLRRHIRLASSDFIGVAEHLITTKSWWDTIDSLAPHTVGPLLSVHPELVATLDRWIEEPNFWLARAAILHQVSFKQATDQDRLFAYCAKRMADREFFVRKAIGWALRVYSKTDPDAVLRFVRDNEAQLSPLSRKEALRRIGRRTEARTVRRPKTSVNPA
jgi:3-methyladenine DNA glycosylase AlkD